MRNKDLTLYTAMALISAFTVGAAFSQEPPVKSPCDSAKTAMHCEKKGDDGGCQKVHEACCKAAMTCPVSGKPASKEFFSEYKGNKVFFGCAECKAAFDKDPEKFSAKIQVCGDSCKAQMKECRKKQEGKDEGCKSEMKKDCKKHEGKGEGCKSEMKKDCKKHEGKDEGCKDKSMEHCCKAAMTCPVSGKPASKEFFSEYKGNKVFFGCAECKAAFDKDPEKFAAKIHVCEEGCKAEMKKECGKKEKETDKQQEKQ
jgi:YHS domain-containing protein